MSDRRHDDFDRVYGKPFHGWSCDCDECQQYDAAGQPRPGEAPLNGGPTLNPPEAPADNAPTLTPAQTLPPSGMGISNIHGQNAETLLAEFSGMGDDDGPMRGEAPTTDDDQPADNAPTPESAS